MSPFKETYKNIKSIKNIFDIKTCTMRNYTGHLRKGICVLTYVHVCTVISLLL